MSREGRTTGLYLSPAAQGYLAWAVRWLKTSQSGAVEEALRRLVEQGMCYYSVYTTWNAVARAVQHLPGNWDGLEEREEDLDVCLVALHSPVNDQPILGWLEMETRTKYGGFDTAYFDSQGRGTTIPDWLPPEVQALAPKREGIAVPVEVLGYILPE